MSDEGFSDLLEQALETLEQDGEAGLARFLALHPQQAERLQAGLASLNRFGVLRGESEAAAPPTQLGEFKLKERLGSGGMGIVYRAEQPSLQREVALKVIRPEHLFFAGARERFLREVQAIAQLEHPGIVRVYEAGEAGGLPWFTMERIDGLSLEALIDALRERGPAPTDDRALARVLTELRDAAGSRAALPEPQGRSWVEICFRWTKELADALAYAHDLGVLHRDLKPANVMVTWSGRVMLLDFGLATTRTSTRITRTGSLVGSVPYMAPEQLRGERDQVDARTDVYSLGVTLYELLALRHPFHEKDAGSEATRRRILDGALPSLRRVAAAVPWDAETVCLTAMERDPARRYPSAGAFAADLANVLQFRPIAARRPGAALRARRFAQRHPAWSVGALLGSVLVAGTPLGLWWAQVERTRAVTREQSKTKEALGVVTRQRDEITQQRDEIDVERQLAERRFGTALDAVADLLAQVGYTKLNNVPNAGVVRRELLELAERSAQKLLAQLPDHPRAQYVAGWVDQLLAKVLQERGLRDEARRYLERSCATLKAIDASAPPDPQRRLVHAMSEGMLATVYHEERRLEEAEEHYDLAIALHRAAIDATDDVRWEDQHKRHLASSLLSWGGTQARELKLVDEGIASVTEACDLLEEVGTSAMDTMRFAQALNNLASIHDGLDQREEAEELFARSLEALHEAAAELPANYEIRKSLALTTMNLGAQQGKLKKYERSIPTLTESVALARVLHADFPEKVEVVAQLATALDLLGAQHFDRGEPELLEPLVREAITLRDGLIAASGGTPELHAERAIGMDFLIEALRKTGRAAEAETEFRKAIGQLDDAVRRFPGARARFDQVRKFLETEVDE